MPKENLFEAARRGSNMTQEKAASICGISTTTYGNREKIPGEFRLKELMTLYQNLGDSSKTILLKAIDSLFLSL